MIKTPFQIADDILSGRDGKLYSAKTVELAQEVKRLTKENDEWKRTEADAMKHCTHLIDEAAGQIKAAKGKIEETKTWLDLIQERALVIKRDILSGSHRDTETRAMDIWKFTNEIKEILGF